MNQSELGEPKRYYNYDHPHWGYVGWRHPELGYHLTTNEWRQRVRMAVCPRCHTTPGQACVGVGPQPNGGRHSRPENVGIPVSTEHASRIYAARDAGFIK